MMVALKRFTIATRFLNMNLDQDIKSEYELFEAVYIKSEETEDTNNENNKIIKTEEITFEEENIFTKIEKSGLEESFNVEENDNSVVQRLRNNLMMQSRTNEEEEYFYGNHSNKYFAYSTFSDDGAGYSHDILSHDKINLPENSKRNEFSVCNNGLSLSLGTSHSKGKTNKSQPSVYLSTNERIRPFTCSECGSSFTKKSHLSSHISSVHDNIKPFICQECGFAFAFKHKLKVHVYSVHKKEKPFNCNVCGKHFSRKGCLTLHIQSVHDKEKPFHCNLCTSKFTRKGSLSAHVLTVHENIKPFKCPECGHGFPAKHKLKIHLETVHKKDNPSYRCNLCDHSYRYKIKLLEHIRLVHTKTVPYQYACQNSMQTIYNQIPDVEIKDEFDS